MIDIYPTSREPIRSFVDRLKALQGRDGVLSASLIHGFMAGDVPEMGTKILVVTDNDPGRGRGLARSLGMEVFDMRGKTAMPMLSTDAGLDRAEALAKQHPGKPVVVADVWDNPGGGVAGDGTLILRRIIERGLPNVAVATVWDPIAVSFCRAAGEGARIALRFCGKAGPDGGAPIDAAVEVVRAVSSAPGNIRRSRPISFPNPPSSF
jgi:microcystin degradation protein MlrC